MKKHFSMNMIGICGVVIAAVLVLLTLLAATGSFHYRKTELFIRTSSAEKKYDGKPLKSSQWFLVSGEVAKEHKLIVETRGSQTEIGKSENVASIRIEDTSGLDVTNQYEIKTEFGELEVERRKLSFISESAEKIWDGTPLVQHTVRLYDGSVYGDSTWEAYEFTDPIQVGLYRNTYQIRILDENGEDVSENYEIEREFGDLTIRQGYLLLASGSTTKEYDGLELTNDECRIVEGSVAPGHKLQMKAIGSIQEVGFCRNTIQAVIVDADGMDVTKLYDIQYNMGLLTINPRRLTIRTLDVTRPYYDSAVENDWSLVGGSLLAGDVLSVTTLQKSSSEYDEEVGTFDNSVLYYDIVNERDNKSRTGCYQISFQYGTLVLTE
ncbi:MAG: hypothetical protein IKS10_05845 [Lachnospiraceae bacterium]|nr:hypothetical protein [Lachnospiraceae bacterium]